MPKELACIAVVDDEPAQRVLLDVALRTSGYRTVLCADGTAALEALNQCDLMLLDVRMPAMTGFEVLQRAHTDRPDLPILLLTAFIDVRDAVAAIKAGAVDYLEKPIDIDELISAVDDALGAISRPVSPCEQIPLPSHVAAESTVMRHVFHQACKVAKSDISVLLLGASGAGKDIVAQFVHDSSLRAGKPMIRVNCGALPEHLIESELFGHEKGAFTGADVQRSGQFEVAEGSTLFLDEIGELPLSVQPKFLHVLETGSFRRVGGDRERLANVRVVAATNRNLEDDVRNGTFREDLFYRLNVFPLTIPPLRERPDDILAIADIFLKPRKLRLSPAAERLLMAYDWPGNVRELRNALERAGVLADGSLILPKDLPPQLHKLSIPQQAGPVLVGDMEEIQRRAILEAVEKTRGNKTQAAALLGISRRNLIYKLRGYGM